MIIDFHAFPDALGVSPLAPSPPLPPTPCQKGGG